MDQEMKYNETVQEISEKLNRDLKEEEKNLLKEIFNLDNNASRG